MANDPGKKPAKNNNRVVSAADTANKATTRGDARKTGMPIVTPADNKEVTDANEGREFLEKRLLLCLPKEEFTLTSLISCLHQVARMGGITKTVATAVLAVMYLAEELEEISVNTFIRDAVNSQFTELTSEVKLLLTDTQEKLGEMIHNTDKVKTTDALRREPEPAVRSYSQMLINPPPHANPRLAAREGIRARQFMIEGPQRESTIGQMNGIQLKNEFNRILGELSQADNKVRSAVVQRNRGILLEIENNNGAAWMRMTDNCTALCKAIGNNAYFRTRTYNLIAFNVDLTVEPENQVHRDEISEANHLEIGSIMSM
jgi:hypothetical protein